jgi:hypothetical protein
MAAPAGEIDHLIRDARDAAFHEIAVALGKYRRRLVGDANRNIDNLVAGAEGEVDGTALGREAARNALAPYLGTNGPQKAIEAGTAEDVDA